MLNMVASGDLTMLELDSFDMPFAVPLADKAAARRRFMTLFLDESTNRHYGSSGCVCKAFNARGETFAVKYIRRASMDTPVLDDPTSHSTAGERAMFRAEYENQLQIMQLEGFPKLFGYGMVGQEPVIVMEWVHGVTLREAHDVLAPAGKAEPQTVALLGKSLFSLLTRLGNLSSHPVHRDLSPSNIMLRTQEHSVEEQVESGAFEPCIVDFGSTTFVAERDTRLTLVAGVWRGGTPEYAPPEMLTRDVPNIEQMRQSPSIDVYAVCSVLYELLAGHTPFQVSQHSEFSPYRLKVDTLPKPLKIAGYEKLCELILRGLSSNQLMRPTANEMEQACERAAHISDEAANGLASFNVVLPASSNLQTQTNAASSRSARAAVTSSPYSTATAGERRPARESASHAESAPWKATSSSPTYDTSAPSVIGASASVPEDAAGAIADTTAATFATTAEGSGAGTPERPISRRKFVALAVAGVAAVSAVAVGTSALARSLGTSQDSASDQASSSSAAEDTSSASATTSDSEVQGDAQSSGSSSATYSSGTLYRAQDASSELWGFLNAQRQWVIEPQFSDVPGPFSESLAAAKQDSSGLYGYLDYWGNWAIEPQFASASMFSEGLAVVESTGSGDFGVGGQANRAGWVDKNGSWAIAAKYGGGGAFVNGLAPVGDLGGTDQRWGYINTSGDVTVPYQFYKAEAQSDVGLAPAADHVSHWGFVDTAGNWVIEPQYPKARKFSEGLAACMMDSSSEKWGFIDASGATVIGAQFREARSFSGGLAAACDAQSGLWGSIGTDGSWQISPKFQELGEFVHGLAPAQDAETQLYGYIDDTGEWVIAPQFMAVGFTQVE